MNFSIMKSFLNFASSELALKKMFFFNSLYGKTKNWKSEICLDPDLRKILFKFGAHAFLALYEVGS